VAHNAANMASASANMFVNSVVLFSDLGDGYPFGTVPASKVSTDCHVGDDICAHSDWYYRHISLTVSMPARMLALRSRRVGSHDARAWPAMAQVEVFIGVFSRSVGGFVLLGKLSLVATLIHFDGHG
jgi:hypothetical protein